LIFLSIGKELKRCA